MPRANVHGYGLYMTVMFQFSLFVLPLLVTVCSSIILCTIAWWYREYPFAREIIVMLLGASWWSLAYIAGFTTASLELRRLAYSLAHPGIGVVSITWLVFAVKYTGEFRPPARSELAMLGIIPVLTGITPLTGQFRGLVWVSVSTLSQGPIELSSHTHGILWWLHMVQACTLVGIGTVLMLSMAVRTDDIHRSRTDLLMFSAVMPAVGAFLYVSKLTGPVNLTPSAFSLSGTMLISTVFRDQLLLSMPLARETARDELLERMSSAVIFVDSQERVADFNAVAESMAAVTGTDAIGSPVEAVFPEIVDTIDTHDESSSSAEMVRVDDGSKKYYEVENMPLQHENGLITGRLLTVHDITKRKRNENRLQDEQEFINQALDALNDTFYVINSDKDTVRWNEQLNEVTGYTDDEIENLDPSELFPPEHRDQVKQAIRRVYEDGEAMVEAPFLTADGERVPFEFTGVKLTDVGGETMIAGVGRDISMRKAREYELRTFQEAVEGAGRMIYWMDRDGTVEYANPALATRLGLDAADIIGGEKAPLTMRAESEGLAEEMLATLLGGKPWEREFVTQLPSGEQLRVAQSVTPIYDGEEITRFVAIAGDITSTWRRNQQLSVLQRILRHDLRNNLNSILLSVQMAGKEAESDAVRDHIDSIEKTIDETLSLSRDIKQSTRAFENRETTTKVVNLAAVTRAQVETIRAERPSAEFDVDLPGGTPVVASDMIKQAVRNVITNAIEHNDKGTPRVTIDLVFRDDDETVELRIADNGPGIPDDTKAVLKSEKEEQLSHLDGFGLWLVRWVVTLSGGRLEFAENDPQGAVVKLVLPAAEIHDNDVSVSNAG